jgi:predicted DNA-binding transcriptional regulator AlpA
MADLPNHPSSNFNRAPDSHDPEPATLVLEGFLRRDELAHQLGLSPRTIDRWQTLRKGPPRICIGRTILYQVESVREWLRTREQHPTIKRGIPRFHKS